MEDEAHHRPGQYALTRPDAGDLMEKGDERHPSQQSEAAQRKTKDEEGAGQCSSDNGAHAIA